MNFDLNEILTKIFFGGRPYFEGKFENIAFRVTNDISSEYIYR